MLTWIIFFAAVEEKLNPSIKNKPVIVGADPKQGRGRGVVSTCNYLARKYGLKSGMPISKAYKLCPEGIYLPVNIQLYRKVSERIMSILRRYAVKFQQVSIDEAFLDVTRKVKSFDEAEKLALEIKKEILEKEGLTCSIGVAPNKLVAKIASNFSKPDGLLVIKPGKVKDFLSPLKVELLWGIGEKTAEKLKKLGIETIGDLAQAETRLLIEKLGNYGGELQKLARGLDESEVEERGITKSVSKEKTFERDTKNKFEILSTLMKLCSEVLKKVKKKKLLFRTVTVKVRFEDFETHSKSKTLKSYVQELNILKSTANELFRNFSTDKRKVRLVGVKVSNLLEEKYKTILEYV